MFNKNNPTLMYFFAEWCPHCKNFQTEWNNIKKQLGGKSINLVERSCVKYPEYCNSIKPLNGYPSIFFISQDDKLPIEYTGNRTSKDLIKFTKSLIKN